MSKHPRYSMTIQWSDEDRVYITSFPEWEEHGLIGHTHGDTYEEAARNGQEVLHLLMESAQAEGETIPEPRLFGAQALDMDAASARSVRAS